MPRRRRLRDRTVLINGERVLATPEPTGSGPRLHPGAATYTILAHIGHGAFSEVYAAATPSGARVALKEVSLHCPYAEQHERRRLVQQEAAILRAAAGHPLILRLYDAFARDHYLYTVVTLIEGRPLTTRLAEAREDHDLLTEWGCKLGRAVAWLHQIGIVHHDLKPENILVDSRNDPIIVDYGAAGRADAPDHTLYGSDGYLPPEVCERILRGDVGARLTTDVFALGILLYQMLLGRVPSQDDINALSHRVAGPLLRNLERVNPALARIIVRAMSFAETHRYTDALRMVDDFRALIRPIARADRYHLDFGALPPGGVAERRIRIFNVGGGDLHGEVTTDEQWLTLQVGDGPTGARLVYQGDITEIRVKVMPEALPERERVDGNIGVTWPSGGLRVHCVATRHRVPRAPTDDGPAPLAGRPSLWRRVLGVVRPRTRRPREKHEPN